MENKKTFNVEGMMCPHCEARVKSVLEAIDGISLAEPSHKKKKVTLTLNGTVEDSVIIQAIEGAGYKVV